MANKKQQKNSTAFLGSAIHLNNYASNLAKQLTPFFEVSKMLDEAVHPIQEMQKQAIDSIISIGEAQRQMIESSLFAVKGFSNVFEGMVKPLEDIRTNISNLIIGFSRTFDQLPERTRKALMALAQHGWYLDFEMSFGETLEIESILESGDIETANAFLIQHFTERIPEIRRRLKEKHPKRANIFESAFNAHQQHEYALSVPTFLIQADGICFDLINKQLYSKRNKTPVLNEYAKSIASDTFQSALLYPLTQPLPITASSNERADDFNELNRHQVIHGESTNYDIEINSLKAISLLSYVSYVLCQDDEDGFAETKSEQSE